MERESQVEEVSQQKVYIALGSKVEGNERNLKYALKTFKDSELVLLHIHNPSETMPGPMGVGKMPCSSVAEVEVKRFRDGERKNMEKAMGQYLRMCDMEQVKADKLVVESRDIQSGITQLVSQYNIKRLVMGAANDKSFNKQMSAPSSKKAQYVNLKAAVSCQIWFVCKGVLICIKEAGKKPPARVQSEKDALPPRHNKLSDKPYMSFPERGSKSQAGGIPDLVRNHSGASSVFSSEIDSRSSDASMLTRDEEREVRLDYAVEEKGSSLLLNMGSGHGTIDESNPIFQEKQKVKIAELSAKNNHLQERITVLQKQLHELSNKNLFLKEKNEGMIEMQKQLHELSNENRSLKKKNEDMIEMQRSPMPNYLEFKLVDLKAATNQFDVRMKIGQGGFGTVYRGSLRYTGVAIKRFNPENTHGQAQFQQEIVALTRVRHPHLVALIGACSEEQCLVYEFVENGSLHDRLFEQNEDNPLRWRDRLRIAAEICLGLIFLHSASIVHGDLKPANILLDANNRAKIADFGICRFLPEPQRESAATVCRLTHPKGTMEYMDPEFMSTKELTFKSDVYGLGVILLQLLTRKSGFGLKKVVEDAVVNRSLYQILDCDAGSWDSKEAADLAKLGLRCCEVSRSSRPNVETVWKALEGFL